MFKSYKKDDFVVYAGIVKRECEIIKLNELSPDMLKSLFFVQEATFE